MRKQSKVIGTNPGRYPTITIELILDCGHKVLRATREKPYKSVVCDVCYPREPKEKHVSGAAMRNWRYDRVRQSRAARAAGRIARRNGKSMY